MLPWPTLFPTSDRAPFTAPAYDPGTVEFKLDGQTVGLGLVLCMPAPAPYQLVELLLLHPDYPKVAPRLVAGARPPAQLTVKQCTAYKDAADFRDNAWAHLKAKRPGMTKADYVRSGAEWFRVTDAAAFPGSAPPLPAGPQWADRVGENTGSDEANTLIVGLAERQLHQLSNAPLDDTLIHTRVSEPTTTLAAFLASATVGTFYARTRIETDSVTGGPLRELTPPTPPSWPVAGAMRLPHPCE